MQAEFTHESTQTRDLTQSQSVRQEFPTGHAVYLCTCTAAETIFTRELANSQATMVERRAQT